VWTDTRNHHDTTAQEKKKERERNEAISPGCQKIEREKEFTVKICFESVAELVLVGCGEVFIAFPERVHIIDILEHTSAFGALL
jgi:hypothetical protein